MNNGNGQQQQPQPRYIDAGADLAAPYRYRLWRKWDNRPQITWVMLNPSSADANDDDPTMRRVVGFSRMWKFGGCQVVNLFGLISSAPDSLRTHESPIGQRNNEAIGLALELTRLKPGEPVPVLVGWGDNGKYHPGRVGDVVELIGLHGGLPICLGNTKSGHPCHPLFLRPNTQRQPWGGWA